MKEDQTMHILDDIQLLDLIIKDSKGQKDFYNPGPYWINKLNNSVKEIYRYGISDFS